MHFHIVLKWCLSIFRCSLVCKPWKKWAIVTARKKSLVVMPISYQMGPQLIILSSCVHCVRLLVLTILLSLYPPNLLNYWLYFWSMYITSVAIPIYIILNHFLQGLKCIRLTLRSYDWYYINNYYFVVRFQFHIILALKRQKMILVINL